MDNITPPKENYKDKLHALVKGGLGSIPVAGSLAAELFGMIITSPISKRRDEWLLSIVNKIVELEQRESGFDIGTLGNNEEFTSYLLETSQIVIKNHQEEKLSALRNCIANFFVQINTPYDKKISFIRLVDEITPTHLSILSFIIENENKINSHDDINLPDGITSFPLLFDYFIKDHLEIERTHFRKCVFDLDTQSLIRLSKDFRDWFSGDGYATDEGAKNIEVLEYGRDFIQYISG